MSLGELVIGKCEGRIAVDCLIQQANGLGSGSRARGVLKAEVAIECFGPDVQIVSYQISRWFLLDRRFFAGRDFGLKLRDYLPSQLAFDRKHIGNIAIVTFRPKLAVRSRIDQLSVDAHSTAGALHCAFQHVRYAERRRRSRAGCASAPVLYCITDVRLITFRSATLERPVRISSWTPSAK